MPHLPPHHFPILADTAEITSEHNASHKRCVIKRKQVPIEPGFAMTTHKAQEGEWWWIWLFGNRTTLRDDFEEYLNPGFGCAARFR